MFCHNCGAQISESDTFCGHCGSKIKEETSNKIIDEIKEETKVTEPIKVEPNKDTRDLDKELVDAYMGVKAPKFRTNDFSFCTFFFRGIYLMYRKMYGYGLLWMFVAPIIFGLIPVVGTVAPLIAAIVMGFMFNKIYVNFVEKKVNELKYLNKNKSHEELLDICSKMGGTTWVPVIIILAIYGILIVLLIVALVFLINSGKLDEIIDEVQNEMGEVEEVEKTPETVIFDKDTTKESGSLLYTVPKGFEEVSSIDVYSSYIYSNNDWSDYCTFKLSNGLYYGKGTIEEEMNKNIYATESDEVTKGFVTINGQEWYGIKVSNSYDRYKYGIIKDGRKYTFEFSNVISGDVCGPAKDKVLNSLKFGDANV